MGGYQRRVHGEMRVARGSIIMIFIALLACVSVCFAQRPHDAAWDDWKLEYGKVYSAEEEPSRYATWLKSKEDVALHNADYEQTYTVGLNEFSDMTQEEFAEIYLTGLRIPEDIVNGTAKLQWHDESTPVVNGDEVNWVNQGYVTPIKNQGRCGSCYSFSATGALEGQWFKKTGKLESMSEQQIVDCSGRYGNHGCQGGWYHSSWNYIRDAGGEDSESSYPYTARKGWFCRFSRRNVVAKDTGSIAVGRSESSLQQAVGSVGPVSVAIDAGRPGFRSYRGGVFYDSRCSQRTNHAVLAVGYGSENGQDYWLVKNSWGTRYGLGGYIKMARNRGNLCAIASYAAYPGV